MQSHFRALAAMAIIVTGCLLSQTTFLGRERKTSGGKKLAVVDGSAITENQARTESADELEALELQKLRAKASFALSEHRIIEDAVEQLIEDKLLQVEAAKQGISREELLLREVQKNAPESTTEEIEKFYESNKHRIQEPKEEVAVQIGEYLKEQRESAARQALMERLENTHRVIRSFEPLRFDVNAAGRPSMGPSSAPVTLILFSDFECPYCKGMSETLKEVVKQYGKKVRLVFRQMPLTNIHPLAQQAAEASLCALDQGRFWEMHDILFQDQGNLGYEDLKSKADQLGLNIAAFNACLDGKRSSFLVREDVRAAAGAGVDGTPTLYINGRFLNGNRSYEQIAAIIDEELQRKK